MKSLRFALKRTFPIFFTYLFIGIAFGILMADAGYAPLWAGLSSLFIYAGSMQIIMVPMLTARASLWSLAVMALFVNARHLFYGLGFIDRFRKTGWRCPYLIYALTDETYSVFCSLSPEELADDNALFLIALLNHLYWIFGSLLGACAGSFLKFDLTGIDFSATAFFLVVVVNQWKQSRNKAPFITALICAVGCLLFLGADGFLIPALTLCVIALLAMEGRLSHE